MDGGIGVVYIETCPNVVEGLKIRIQRSQGSFLLNLIYILVFFELISTENHGRVQRMRLGRGAVLGKILRPRQKVGTRPMRWTDIWR